MVSRSTNGSHLRGWRERPNSKTLRIQPRVLHDGSALTEEQTRSAEEQTGSTVREPRLWSSASTVRKSRPGQQRSRLGWRCGSLNCGLPQARAPGRADQAVGAGTSAAVFYKFDSNGQRKFAF